MRIHPSQTVAGKPLKRGQEPARGEKSFGQILKESIEEVNRLQGAADHAIEELTVGGTKNIHETMIALEKAEISFKLMLQVRNKILEAYHEVMRMNV
ncbi:MAG: flagellar hook-basal body complex protein FliE [Deltaproteobacteria bacterium]|nr:flagellar hook-basal body complex protein FliE [Deltaproteobacteria bacterium]MBW2123537.1 flagellar hook-basal body complex protein FliE [Deltaproteobacteria bacterium]